MADEIILAAWVHVSDLHFGHGGADHQWDQSLVLSALRYDLRALIDRGGAPSPRCVFVTGDVAFSGGARAPAAGPSEYLLARRWLADLESELHLPPANVFLVPGNHDVDRSVDRSSPDTRRLIGLLRSGAEHLDEVLRSGTDEQRLQRRLSGFLTLADELHPAHRDDFHGGLWWKCRLTLPEGVGLRICGLNTALLCADDADHGKLRVGNKQLADLLPPAAPLELVLVLSHHPAAGRWMADQKDLRGWLDKYADIHLCGHIHEAESRQVAHGWGQGAITITAGAAHAEQTRPGAPPGHGYNVGAIVVLPTGELAVRIWPRIWSERTKAFVLDAENVRSGRDYAEHALRHRLDHALAPALEIPRGLLSGRTLAGRYHLIEAIGRGGVGEVWSARDGQSGGIIALKVINPDGRPPDPARLATFFRGAATMARIRHPAIVRVHEPRVEAEGFFFYTMALIEGESLGAIYRGKPGTDREAIDTLLGVGEALAAAHAAKIIHRDLKPSNLLRDRQGGLYVIDFDTVRELDSGTKTHTGGRMATFAYAAPEVLSSLNSLAGATFAVDERADIYSIAAIGVFIITGQDPGAHFINRMHEYVDTLACSARLRRALSRACAYRPEDRHSSVAELIEELSGALVGAAVTTTAAQPQPASSARVEAAPLHLSEPDPPAASAVPHAWVQPLPTAFANLSIAKLPAEHEEEPPAMTPWDRLANALKSGYRDQRGPFVVGAGFALILAVVAVTALVSAMVRGPCPEGMVMISAGNVDGAGVARFCMDLTEVRTGDFLARSTSAAREKISAENLPRGYSGGEGDQHCNARSSDRAEHPVNCVDYAQASGYCVSLGKRLPSSYEWRWAAGGRESHLNYPWGDDEPTCARAVLRDVKNTCSKGTAPTGTKPAGDTRDGVKDLAGNVAEWTSTRVDGVYVTHGGSWAQRPPLPFRVSQRASAPPQLRSATLGFRCVSDLPQ